MYVKLLIGYAVVFALVVGYLVYLQRRLNRLEQRLGDIRP